MNNLSITQAKPRELNDEFLAFYGTHDFYKYSSIFPYRLTDGTKYVAEKLGLYWLYDTISSHQAKAIIRSFEFQTWRLRKITEGKESGKWEVVFEESGITVIRQVFSSITLNNNYEDKFDLFTVYLSNNVIYLPSEY